MKSLLIIVTLSVNMLPSVQAQTLGPVTLDMFKTGNYWVWEYLNNKKQRHSLERYQVVAVTGSKIDIEMASKLEEGEEWNTHHKFRVNLNHCLNAYKSVKPNTWALEGFFYRFQGRQWLRAGNGSNVQVFEEKFSCIERFDVTKNYFEHIFSGGYLADLGDVELVKHRRINPPAGQYDSWYIYQPYSLAGIAGRKTFNPGKEDSEYHFQLIDWFLEQ